MRFLATTALVLNLPSLALADDFTLRADIAEALVYAQGAEVTRAVAIDLPAGEHSLFIPMRDLGDPSLIEVRGPDGLRIGAPVPLDRIAIAEGSLDSEAEARARAAVEAAEDGTQAAQDALARRDAEIMGLQTQLAYLTGLTRGGPEGVAMPTDPATLSALLATLGTETARINTELQAARETRRADEDRLEEAMLAQRAAEIALQALTPFGTDSMGIRLDVQAVEPTSGTIEIAYLTPDAQWQPAYDLNLDSETGQLDIDRSITLRRYGPAVWRDVAVRFSTAIPDRRRFPSFVGPDAVRINPPMPEPAVRGGLATADMEAMMEAPAIVMEDRAAMIVSGLSVVYDYAAPVSVGPSGEVTLPFDGLSIDMELENRAVPRRDSTAFLVAMGENTTGETILPGHARFFRDGDLVGDGSLDLIAPGAEVEMAFGPLDHLQLTWIDLSLDEGDRGFFISENEQRRRIAFSVENTSGTAEPVRLLYATPFAEQEDIEVDVRYSRAPDATDVDDLRGVSAWDLTVAPGETARIEMTVELTWPDGMFLSWAP
jgi:uncharacterized protein (TIGR02231 family)